MNKQKFLSLVVIIVLSFSCRDDYKRETVIIDKFPETKFVDGERIETGPYYGLNQILIIDTFLLVGAEIDESNLFHVYSTNTGSFISELILRGRGPCEVVIPSIIPQKELDNSGLLLIYDIGQWSIIEYDISQFILNPAYSCSTYPIDIPITEGTISSIKYKDNRMIMYENGRSRFTIYDKRTREFTNIPYQSNPPEFKLKEENEKRIFYSGGLRVNKPIGRVVSAPYSVGKLDFYQSSGEHISSVVFSDYAELTESIQEFNGAPNPSLAYLNLYTFNLFSDYEFIYLVTTDPIKTRGEIMMNYGAGISDIRSLLLIFDWDGNPIKKVVFDRFLVQTGMDMKTMTLYGLSPNSDDGLSMYKYCLGQ